MDIFKAIQELIAERDRLDAAIECLEQILGGEPGEAPQVKSRRGRKSMGEEERQQVSRRMVEYWAQRRRKESGNNP